MSRPKSLYLTPRTMSALRPADALSGRVNQIVDRYLELVAMQSARVRSHFLPSEWAAMVQAVPSATTRDLPAEQELGMLIRNLTDQRLIGLLNKLSAGKLFTLIELLEADRAKVDDPLPAKPDGYDYLTVDAATGGLSDVIGKLLTSHCREDASGARREILMRMAESDFAAAARLIGCDEKTVREVHFMFAEPPSGD